MLSKFEVHKALCRCASDGHTIYKEEAFSMLPKEFLDKYVQEYESEGHGKTAIYDNDGNRLDKVYGVHGLKLLYGMAYDIGADTKEAESKSGRGFQADCLTRAINKRLLEMP